MSSHPAVRLLFVFMLVLGLFSLLLKWGGSFLVLLIVLLVALVVLIVFMLKRHPRKLSKVYRYPVCKQAIDLVCRVGKYQVPVAEDSKREDSAGELMLVGPVDFSNAAQKLKRIVVGHDEQIDRLLDQLRASIILRCNSVTPISKPLGAFFLAGPSGIGKRFIARKLSRLLYRKPGVVELNMNNYSDESSAISALIGNETRAGRIIKAAKENPYHAFIIENCDATPFRLQSILASIMGNGVLLDPSNQAPVDFRHCVFFFLTTSAVTPLVSGEQRAGTRRERNQFFQEALAEHTALELSLLSYANEIFLFRPLEPLQRAEVVLMLMQRECRKYQIALEYVDAELLAKETTVTAGPEGFAMSPARIAHLLRDPLVRATKLQQPRLSLRSNEITMIRQPEISSQ